MAKISENVSCILLGLCLILIASVEVSARGGRGGGGRGGRSGGRSFGRSRSSSGSRSGSISRGGRFGGFGWKSAAAAGMIYGYSSYSHRRRYYSSPNSEPTICTNRYNYQMTNGTSYTYFICPMANQAEDNTYCCGPSDRQKCCRFGDDAGRVAGVVIGVLLFVAIIGSCVWCFCCKKSKKPKQEGSILSQPTFGKSPSYPLATATAGAQPPPSQGPMPTYPQDPGMKYGQPEGNNVYPPPNGDPYPPAYGINPPGPVPAYPPPQPAYPPNDPNNPMGDATPYPTGPMGYPSGPPDAAYPPQPMAYPPQPQGFNIPPGPAPAAYPSAPPPAYGAFN